MVVEGGFAVCTSGYIALVCLCEFALACSFMAGKHLLTSQLLGGTCGVSPVPQVPLTLTTLP